MISFTTLINIEHIELAITDNAKNWSDMVPILKEITVYQKGTKIHKQAESKSGFCNCLKKGKKICQNLRDRGEKSMILERFWFRGTKLNTMQPA